MLRLRRRGGGGALPRASTRAASVVDQVPDGALSLSPIPSLDPQRNAVGPDRQRWNPPASACAEARGAP